MAYFEVIDGSGHVDRIDVGEDWRIVGFDFLEAETGVAADYTTFGCVKYGGGNIFHLRSGFDVYVVDNNVRTKWFGTGI